MVTRRKSAVFILIAFILTLQPISAVEEVDVIHYIIQFSIDPQGGTAQGATTIETNATDLDTLTLNLDDDLHVESVVREGEPLNFTRKGGKIIIPFMEPLAGLNRISIIYHGALDAGDIGHRWAYIGNNSAYGAYEASWYPHSTCDHATGFINIQVPRGWVAISNGDLIYQDENTNTYSWEVRSRESGFSFASGRYFGVRKREFPPTGCFLLFPKLGCAIMVNETLGFFSSKLTSYPYPKLALAEVRGALNGGHGGNSLILLSQEIVRGPDFEEFLIHETAHNWFGGLVSSEDSKWLTEGFASYGVFMFFEEKDPKLARRYLANRWREYFFIRERNNDRPILSDWEERDQDFQGVVYGKGAYVLHMLRHVMGDEQFFTALQKYLETHQGGCAKVDDFQKVAEEVSAVELDWFFDEWLNSTAFPDYSIDSMEVVEADGGKYTVHGKIKQGEDVVKMPVDVVLVTSKGEITKKVWTDSETTDFEFQAGSRPILVVIDRDGWQLERRRINNRRFMGRPFSTTRVRAILSYLALKLGLPLFF